jgi:hypothetical protein
MPKALEMAARPSLVDCGDRRWPGVDGPVLASARLGMASHGFISAKTLFGSKSKFGHDQPRIIQIAATFGRAGEQPRPFSLSDILVACAQIH